MHNLTGYWTGEISGTNQGGFTFDLKQSGHQIEGTAKVYEQALGGYTYVVTGSDKEGLRLYLVPGKTNDVINLGNVTVLANHVTDTEVTGRWSSDIGTEGAFKMTKFDEGSARKDLPKTNSVFVVHGHDEGSKHSVARFLEKLGIEPVILQEQINRGMTIIEKFEDFASRAGFAVILMTPDDYGYPKGKEESRKPRARQNVVLELGYFAARLGRQRTLVLKKGDIEMPSDILGLAYEPMDESEGWKLRLARELKACKYDVDFEKGLA